MSISTVISANRLADGTVAYLAADGNWVGSLDAARIFLARDEETEALETAQRAIDRNIVLDPLVVEVADTPAGRRAKSLRNSIRAGGPTVNYAAAAAAGRSRHVPL
jgi:Protein of unknown function (DUF2849)